MHDPEQRPEFYLPPKPPGEPGTAGPGSVPVQRRDPSHENPSFGLPPQGWSGQHQATGQPPGRRGISWWLWVVIALAVVSVLGLAVFAASLLPLLAQPKSPDWTAVPHADEGVFLDPSYAEGAREFTINSRGVMDFVGASKDGGVIAINVDHEVQGIDAGTTETLWTYPSYSCSQGTWDGIALCVDERDPLTAWFGDVPDMIGLDLATGEPTFRFTPSSMPSDLGVIGFIGSDDVHGYFSMSLLIDEEPYSEGYVLAMTSDGRVSWMTALGTSSWLRSAALVADGRVAVDIGGRVVMLDRATGDVALDRESEAAVVTFTWEGWTNGGRKHFRVSDQQVTPTTSVNDFNTFIPFDGHLQRLGAPVYEFEALNRTDSFAQHPWAVTRDGEPVFVSRYSTIANSEGRVVVEDATLRGLSGDGSLLLSDKGNGTIHDAETGEVIGSFAEEPGGGGRPTIIDGIVVLSAVGAKNDEFVVLLPGAAEG